MGIYPNHGVEYWIDIDKTFDNNTLKNFIEQLKSQTSLKIYTTLTNSICVLSTSRTDDRLEKSKYYNDRKQDWFPPITCSQEWRKPIEDQSLVDIEISESEMDVIDIIRKQLNGHITFEGWFDVNTISYAY